MQCLAVSVASVPFRTAFVWPVVRACLSRRHIHVSKHSSPNFRDRQNSIDSLIFHYTGMPEFHQRIEWLCTPGTRASAHFLIDEGGQVHQLVDEEKCALHCGQRASWLNQPVLDRSIAIEVHNPGHEYGYVPYNDKQTEAVVQLSQDLVARYHLSPFRILAHSDIEPVRFADPGELFPWKKLAAAGVGVVAEVRDPDPAVSTMKMGDKGEHVRTLQKLLEQFGYHVRVRFWVEEYLMDILQGWGEYDAVTTGVVASFQMHHRQRLCNGEADSETQSVLRALLGLRDKT